MVAAYDSIYRQTAYLVVEFVAVHHLEISDEQDGASVGTTKFEVLVSLDLRGRVTGTFCH